MKKILIVMSLFISYSFIPSDNALIGYWKFNEGAGNILINSAPNAAGTNAINNGATWDVSPFGKCLKFVRTSSQFASCALSPINLQTGTPMTLSAWINTSNANLMTVMADWNVSVTPGWEFTINEFTAGKIDLLFTNSVGSAYFGRKGSINVNDGTWRHVVATYDGSNAFTGIKLYMNGVLETMVDISNATWTTAFSNNTDFRIGCRKLSGANNQFFDGKMALPMIWKRALTAQEVQQLYADGLNKIKENN